MRLAELEIPRQVEFVSLARLVVSSIAGDRYEMTDDQIDSLKLAVSEVCVLAMRSGEAPEALAIECDGRSDRLDVLISNVVNLDDDTDLNEPGLPLIASLVDNLVVENDEGRSSLRITLFCNRAEEL